MGDAVGLDMSLAALQSQDPYISSIMDVASQVALYTFNSKANEWEKTDTEGTLFIYTRLASPKHGFTIRNRLRPENLTEPITKDLDFQVQDPFLLYRNTHLTIRGIWFYNNEDCVRIAQRIKTLSQQEQVSDQPQGGRLSPDRGEEKTVDILQLLNKARTEYNKVGCSSEPKQIGGSSVLYGNPNLIKPIPVKPTSQDTEVTDPRSVSLDVLFGFSPQQSPVSRPLGPKVTDGEPGSGGGRGRPPVARSLSYDSVSGAVTLVGGPGLQGPLIRGPGLQGPLIRGPGPSASGSHCTVMHKLIPAVLSGQTLQTLSESPENRLVENGAPLPLGPPLNPHLHPHHHHHHLLHHQQQLHHLHHHHLPQPLPLCWPRLPPPQPAQPLLVEPPGCRHPLAPPPASHPLFCNLCKLGQMQPGQSATGKQGAGEVSPHELLHRLQMVQQQQTQPPYSPARAPPAGLAARFPAQFSGSPGGPGNGISITTTPQKQLLFHGDPGMSTTTTPQKQLLFHGDPGMSTTTTPQKQLQFHGDPGMSTTTTPQKQLQFHGGAGTSITTTPQKQLQFHGGPGISTTTTPNKVLQFQGASPRCVAAPVLLLAPSVFSQSKSSTGTSQDPSCPVLTRTSQDPSCPVLTRAQLQTTLLRLLQTDSSFLDSIYEAYLGTTTKY